MPRKKSLNPKIFQKRSGGPWYFRRFIDGKDHVVNTGTNSKKDAVIFVHQYIALEMEAENRVSRGESAQRTANIIMQSVSGIEIERLSFEESFQLYLETTENFMDLSVRYREIFTTTCKKFFEWCTALHLKYIDEVSDEIARRYAKYLIESHISDKTFDDYVKILSKFFTTVDAMKNLPNRNPFNKVNVKRRKRGLLSEASHRPLEPMMIRAVMQKAAEAGEDFFDLFLVGLHTGMRLKDAALLEWKSIEANFIQIIPHKTKRFGTTARIPISNALREMLSRRSDNRTFQRYVNPFIAELYQTTDGYEVSHKSQQIFIAALGKENISLANGVHRRVCSSIYSFESFRTTLATLFGNHNTEYRTVMEIMGWSSWNMLKIYEKKYQFNSGEKDKEKTDSVNNLLILSKSVSGLVPASPELRPTKNALIRLVSVFSNVAIGKIYGISDVAVKKWMRKWDVQRTRRILSSDLSHDEINQIREELRQEQSAKTYPVHKTVGL